MTNIEKCVRKIARELTCVASIETDVRVAAEWYNLKSAEDGISDLEAQYRLGLRDGALSVLKIIHNNCVKEKP